MRFFAMDLHISVIADFKSANPDIEVVDWCLSGHAWVMKRSQDNPEHINPSTWKDLDMDRIKRFQDKYDAFLRTFDGFIVAHVMAFAMVYEKYQKPILAINSCRYDIPFCWNKNLDMLNTYNVALQRMISNGQLQIVSNNRADQEYTRLGIGIKPDYNPSLCLYTNTRYAPTKNTFMCYNGHLPKHPLISERPTNYKWDDITSYKGIVHFPYETSLMSMFEHFTAGCPLFFPSRMYWKSNLSLTSVSNYWEVLPDTLACASNPDFWIDNSDIYSVFQSPNTYYFDSLEHLFQLLETFEYKDDQQMRNEHVHRVKQKWSSVISTMMTSTYRTKYPAHLCYNRLPLLANVVIDCDYTNSGVKAQHMYPFHHPFHKGDIVFVKTDYLQFFIDKYTIDAPIKLVTGVSDLSATQSQSDYIVNHPNITQWIGCNIPVSHPKITKILIGVGEPERPNGNHETLIRVHNNRTSWDDKQNTICVPYHSNTHIDRALEHMLQKLPFEDYMKEIGKYKFVQCKRGNGIDTHRFCEILLMGSVPVIDHSPLDDLYRQFPCIFVEDDIHSFTWDDSKYQSFLDMFWCVSL